MEEHTIQTDVLIIGAGPSGLLAATCAAAFGLDAHIIDRRPCQVRGGHADGLHPRTMEILHTFGLANAVMQQGHPLIQTQTYRPDDQGTLKSVNTTNQPWNAPSHFNAWALSQRKIQDIMESYISQNSNIRVERGVSGKSLMFTADKDYPIQMTTYKTENDSFDSTHVSRENGADPIISAKYVIGCDGAHSWTRQQLGIEMKSGGDVDMAWAVADIIPITNFPTPRTSNLIFSQGGDMMWMPRENDMVRLYVKIREPCIVDADGQSQVDVDSITPDVILQNVRNHIHPYEITYKYCDWWSSYRIGQRLASHNTDPTSGRAFLAGDSVHTHTPHAGQGMNVSMQDTYNLMWKIKLVVDGIADASLLHTYSDERLVEAQRLIDFDRTMVAIASGQKPPPSVYLNTGANEDEPIEWSLRIQGLQIMYPPSSIISATEHDQHKIQHQLDKGILPPGIVTGMRMPNHDVYRHADGWKHPLDDAFRTNGCFYMVLFVGDVSQQGPMDRLRRLAKQIESLDRIKRITEILTLHTTTPAHVELLDLPDVCHPFHEIRGYDHGKVFYDEEGAAYKHYGVDIDQGRLVLLRPDFYVALQTDLEDFDSVRNYFAGFIL